MQHYHTINGGAAPVEFWWNDEGEADYFVFHFWNAAEIVVSHVAYCRVHRTPRPFPVLTWPSPAPKKWCTRPFARLLIVDLQCSDSTLSLLTPNAHTSLLVRAPCPRSLPAPPCPRPLRPPCVCACALSFFLVVRLLRVIQFVAADYFGVCGNMSNLPPLFVWVALLCPPALAGPERRDQKKALLHHQQVVLPGVTAARCRRVDG